MARIRPSHLSTAEPAYEPSYAAFFAPRSHRFETVDFRLSPSPANVVSYFPTSSPQRASHLRLAALLALVVAFVFAVVAFAVDQLTRALTIALYTATRTLFRVASFWPALIVHVALSAVFVLVAASMVVFIAPLGAGSGIPELKSYLNGVRVPGFLAANSFFVKAVGITFSIAGGLVCGKQGPMIHAAAILGAAVSQGASTRLSWRLNSPLFRFFRTEAWKRDFAAIGAAVGVAAAFGSPMGAWMWVYEEACTHWNWNLGIITLGACLTASVVVRILNYLAMGIPAPGFEAFTLTQFGKLVSFFDHSTFLLKDIPVYLLIGVIGGVVGAVLPVLNKYITLFRYAHVHQRRRRLLESLIIAILTAFLRVLIPYLANDCQPINPAITSVLRNAPLRDYSDFRCPDEQYSPWASVIYNPSDSVVRAMLFTTGPFNFPPAAVAVAFVFYFVLIVCTYGLAVPAGVFFPGFLLGSVYGRLVGIAVQAIFPGRSDVSLRGFAFTGAVSALAGFTRTISVSVIALEAVGGYNASFAAVFVAIIAKLTGDFLYNKGIYDLHIVLKGIPFLSNEAPILESYSQLRVSDVMQSKVIGVRRFAKVSGLIRMLATNWHHSFPVFLKVCATTGKSEGKVRNEKSDDTEFRQDRAESIAVSEIEDQEAKQIDKLVPRTTLIIPNQAGLQATIFDEGKTRLLTLTDQKEVTDEKQFENRRASQIRSPANGKSNNNHKEASKEGSVSASEVVSDTRGDVEEDVPCFELVGVIDRGTLISLLRHECDKLENERNANEGGNRTGNEMITREELDSAWPNTKLMKGNEESSIIARVQALNLTEQVIDLHEHINPDPLLMSDRALPSTAYSLFRSTGARHILVANMRSGRVCGVMTRKDILPASILETLSRKCEMKSMKLL